MNSIRSATAQDASDGEFDEQPKADEPAQETQTRGKKRKASTKRTQTARSTRKKVKMTGGEPLSSLEGLPYDLLFEIFTLLNPGDLVHLARTSKELRVLLMSRQDSGSIWITARSNVVPAPPDCPNDLHEPAYAELLFCKECHYCNRLVNVAYAWGARKRICWECINTHCEEDDNRLKLRHYAFPARLLRQTILPMMPRVRLDEEAVGLRHYGTYVFVEYLKLWGPAYKRAIDQWTWLKDQARLQKKLDAQGDLWKTWFHEYKQHQEAEQQLIIKQRIQHLGQWDEEIDKMIPSELAFPKFGGLKLNDVLVRNWSLLDPQINPYMEGVKERRLQRERHQLLKVRLPILKAVLSDQMSGFSPKSKILYPSASELFRGPLIENIIINTPTDVTFAKEHLAPAVAAVFYDVARRLRLRAEDQLYEHLAQNNFPGGVTDRDVVFDLATTIFHCSGIDRNCYSCKRSVYWLDDILQHKCTRSTKFPEGDRDGESLKQVLKEAFRTHENTVLYDKVVVKFITILLDLCGLCPLTTTKAMMDDVNPIFECLVCNDSKLGRATMTWTTFISHFMDCHNDKTSYHAKVTEPEKIKMLLLTGAEADEARERIPELHRRKRASDPFDSPYYASCAHCDERIPNYNVFCWQSGSFMMRHMENEHGINVVMHEDIVADRDQFTGPPIYYMWPPRLTDKNGCVFGI